ncbi:unnamed protein product [Thelazia callipaeda]|uniref:Secreted protein n=1 Tax=Thelazia callipaeda TaxID=103827 RepID=A0A0N5CTX7_THECL|nr:unnamed protein product [Thelazia callipaeda]
MRYWATVVITSLITSIPYLDIFLHFTGRSCRLFCHGDSDKITFFPRFLTKGLLRNPIIIVESDVLASKSCACCS